MEVVLTKWEYQEKARYSCEMVEFIFFQLPPCLFQEISGFKLKENVNSTRFLQDTNHF